MAKLEKRADGYYERMRHTLERCAGILEMESNTVLLGAVYEELVIDVRCDLCDANLEILLEENYIYPEIAERIVQLREEMAELVRVRRTAAEIRKSNAWRLAAEEAASVLEMLYI